MNIQSGQRGLSLIELMIALLVGLMLLAGLVSLFIETGANIAKTQRQASLNTEGQFALSILAHELEMAGFWGRAFDPTDMVYDNTTMIAGTTVNPDCGDSASTNVLVSAGGVASLQTIDLPWAYQVTRPIVQFDDEDASNEASDIFTCLSDVQAGTDAIGIRRVSGGPISITDTGAHKSGRVYMRADSASGGLFRFTGSDDSRTDPADLATVDVADVDLFSDWPYVPKVFYIRDHSRTPGDGIPTLCYEYLKVAAGSAPGFENECLAEGIEDMQLEFGIDTDLDGVPNYYDKDPDATELTQIATVKVHLLARSATPNFRFNDQNTYRLGSKIVTRNDSFFREVFSTTVTLHNPSRLRTLQ